MEATGSNAGKFSVVSLQPYTGPGDDKKVLKVPAVSAPAPKLAPLVAPGNNDKLPPPQGASAEGSVALSAGDATPADAAK